MLREVHKLSFESMMICLKCGFTVAYKYIFFQIEAVFGCSASDHGLIFCLCDQILTCSVKHTLKIQSGKKIHFFDVQFVSILIGFIPLLSSDSVKKCQF